MPAALARDGGGAGGEQVVFADARSISNDDVLETIISDEGREDVR